jgi:hypothetical protein
MLSFAESVSRFTLQIRRFSSCSVVEQSIRWVRYLLFSFQQSAPLLEAMRLFFQGRRPTKSVAPSVGGGDDDEGPISEMAPAQELTLTMLLQKKKKRRRRA